MRRASSGACTFWGLTSVTISMIFMFLINWRLALVILLMLPVLVAVAFQFQKRILKEFRQVRKINSQITALNKDYRLKNPDRSRILDNVMSANGGDPVAEVPHRDRLMRLDAPFTGEAEEIFRAEHRIQPWRTAWGAEGGTLMLTQRERIRRWRYVWLLDVDEGTSRPWFDLNEDDRYASPGYAELRPLPNGRWVLHQRGDAVYFAGSGATSRSSSSMRVHSRSRSAWISAAERPPSFS